MKRFISIFLVTMMIFSLVACGSNSSKKETSGEESRTITVTALNGASETVEIEVPYDPQRIAVVDMAMLDIIDNLGLGDRVVGSSQTSLDYLQKYVTNKSVANLGSIKEADMEAIMECEPDIIFMGGRMSDSYDELSRIAPVVRLTADSSDGVLAGTKKNAQIIASIFGKEAEVEAKFTDFDSRIAALKEVAEGKTAVVGMCTSGSFNVVGDNGRCSVIGREVGFENLGNDTASNKDSESSEGSRGSRESGDSSKGSSGNGNSSNHGSEASFELIVSLAPDYIFVMDRDAAIGTNGAQLAKDVMENELVMSTDAYKNGNLVILEHPGIWYTAEGGITSFGIMLSDLESALLNK
ncbi:MAG: ABC transporter substrate-binding protein [Lachnospiraceae bacterium]|nr:ABC transporter substrate-binding protein [Lachnospiraceae bacterium]